MRKLLWMPLVGIVCLSGIAFARIGGGNIPYNIAKAKPVTFSHDRHVEDLGLACQKCHPSPYVTREKSKPVTMAQMNQGMSCGACHNEKEAFSTKGNCSTCHK
jgi:c(7)-type cytochrome triheme protein